MPRSTNDFVGNLARIRSSVSRSITPRFYVRFHVLVIALWTFSIGLLTTRVLFLAGIEAMWIRYVLACVLAYLAFLAAVRVWLWFVGYSPYASRDDGHFDPPGDLPLPSGGGRGAAESLSEIPVPGGGGFSGAGASAGFEGGSSATSETAGGISEVGSAAREAGPVGLVVVIFLLLAAVGLLAAGWVFAAAPEILIDVAFEAFLAGTLARSLRNSDRYGWLKSALRSTIVPFIVITAIAGIVGALADHHFPGANTMADVIRKYKE